LAQAEAEIGGSALLLVLSGDVPLVTPATLSRLAEAAEAAWGALATATLAEPGNLGRVLVDERGRLARIIEARDASADELAVRRVNAGLYALPAPEVFRYLARLVPENLQGELYLTDAVCAAAAEGRRLDLVELADPEEALGVNDRVELARIHRLLLFRHSHALMLSGVTILDPDRTVIEPSVRVEPDTVIHPGVSLLGNTQVGPHCTIHQGAWVRDTWLGDGVTIEAYSVLDGAEVAQGCRVGPFARLRPASRLLPAARVGNFVEVKNTELGAGAKANHLAYLGDATVGEGANVGAGVVTCNYDGERKHRTVIGRKAFVGSDTMLVAPVEVGNGASTAAGSVVTKNVPDGALAVARVRQKNLAGRAGGLRRKRRDEREGS
jgi:bifunctional UDP-N-acetylglucosamine pyrophosphorylase/glucosamine-1-phosphate N-acetyltransferase